MGRCFLHIGTHKTGTSALQGFLRSDDPVVAGHIHYPRTGMVLDGQHNVAWELNGDERFDPAKGTFAGLIAEMAAAPDLPSVVSSEDFEYLHARPDVLAAMARALREAGISTTVVVYLRDRVDYLESLYAELTRHGPMTSFQTFVETAVREGAFVFRDRWVFALDYARLLAPFVAAFGREAIVARPYPVEGSLATDFFTAIGLSPAAAPGAARLARANERPDMAEVLYRLRAYLGATRGVPPPALERDVPEGPFHLFDASDAARIADRFAGDDRVLESEYELRLPSTAARPASATERSLLMRDVARRWELA